MKRSAIPNIITSVRIVGAAALLFIPAFKLPFYIIFTLCGFTDALDGYLARRFNAESELGSKLDSIADLIFYGVMVVKLLPVMIQKLPLGVWLMIGAVFAIRLVVYIFAAVKFHRFASLHTYLTKISSALVFLAPYFAPTGYFTIYCGVWSVLGLLAAAEEFAIHISANQYSPRKSIFIK